MCVQGVACAWPAWCGGVWRTRGGAYGWLRGGETEGTGVEAVRACVRVCVRACVRAWGVWQPPPPPPPPCTTHNNRRTHTHKRTCTRIHAEHTPCTHAHTHLQHTHTQTVPAPSSSARTGRSHHPVVGAKGARPEHKLGPRRSTSLLWRLRELRCWDARRLGAHTFPLSRCLSSAVWALGWCDRRGQAAQMLAHGHGV